MKEHKQYTLEERISYYGMLENKYEDLVSIVTKEHRRLKLRRIELEKEFEKQRANALGDALVTLTE